MKKEQVIKALKGPDQVRLRPGVIFGSNDIAGCQHAIFEVISNSIDEARSGYGKEIIISKYGDDVIEVEDFGRGIPIEWNEAEQKFNWELLFCTLYAGGKYDSSSDYEFSLGLNGLGLASTQFASAYMEVIVYSNGFRYELEFKKGENVIVGVEDGFYKTEDSSGRTGTIIRWMPDLEVFTDVKVPRTYFQDILRKQAMVNDGLVLRYREPDNGYEETFCYEHGISSYVDSSVKAPISSILDWQYATSGKDRADLNPYDVKLRVCFAFTNTEPEVLYFHNSAWLEYGGSPDKAVKTAFVNVFNEYLSTKGKYSKNETKIEWRDVQECLYLISSNFSTETSYENQTKKSITNKFVKDAMQTWLQDKLTVWGIESPEEIEKAAAQILINKRSRESSEKSRLSLKKKLTESDTLFNRVQKYVDCKSRDKNKKELYIVEGDSALGAVKLARDAEFQAIMPVRGKVLNCLKAEASRIVESAIIIDIIRVLGCGMVLSGIKTKEKQTFQLDKLKFNKVIICTDADVDGFQIRTLILAMLYRLAPALINHGYVYIVESPLFEIIGKTKTLFAYSDRERDVLLKTEFKGEKTIVHRSKGLGENDPEMMRISTMSPETRKLKRVVPGDIEQDAKKFDILLGDALAERKEYIIEHGDKYLELI
jgi:DNA gyrase subunit B